MFGIHQTQKKRATRARFFRGTVRQLRGAGWTAGARVDARLAAGGDEDHRVAGCQFSLPLA